MATSKRQISEQALRLLAKGDVPSDFHIKEEEIVLLIPQIRDYLAEQDYYTKRQALGYGDIDTRYLSVFEEVEILTDEKKDLKYTVLPATYIQLPDDMGLYHVGPMKGHNKKFKRVSPAFLAMYDGLEARQLHGYVGFWVEGDRIYYTNKFDGLDYACESVLIKMVADIASADDDDEIIMPQSLQLEVINAIVKYYSGTIQQLKDRVNDNTPQP